MRYLRRVYHLPPELEEAFAADLWPAGTLGLRVDQQPSGLLRIEAWFDGDASAPPPLGEDWRARGVDTVFEETLAETDWLAGYRARALPFPVASSLYVDPREPDLEPVAPPPGRSLLRLPARSAFGTGSHESTSLALELLEAMPLAGLSVLDVGTGTGILAFAALKRGARRVVAFDVDPAAAFHARTNSALNGLDPRLFTGRLAALGGGCAPRPGFDLALVNVVPEQI
nr:50S ribosomal protein L11 methyltransferase [Acidobacteriota bacterium]